MSKKVVLLGDLGTDHQGFPPTPVIAGSPDVLIDGKPVARVGDPLAPHSKPKHASHPRAIAAGSATVLINGIPAAVTGSVISCGGVTIGSSSVVIGDVHSPAPFSGISSTPSKPAPQAASRANHSSSALAESLGANGSGNGMSKPVTAGRVMSSMPGPAPTSTPALGQLQPEIEPAYHVVQASMSKTELLSALYGDASAKPNSFDQLNPEFFEKRRGLFKELDFALGSVVRKGMSLDDDAKLKRALGLSSKSIVHNWKTAGVGGILGYATYYERVAKGAKYVRNVGYLGVTLDVSLSALKIREACTAGDEKECQVVAYQEGGKLLGSMGGGAIGGSVAAASCLAFAVTTAGIGGVACAVIVGGLGATAGGVGGGIAGKAFGEKLRETIDRKSVV